MGSIAIVKLLLAFASGAIPGLPRKVSAVMNVANTSLSEAEKVFTTWAASKGKTVPQFMAELDVAHPEFQAEVDEWVKGLEAKVAQEGTPTNPLPKKPA